MVYNSVTYQEDDRIENELIPEQSDDDTSIDSITIQMEIDKSISLYKNDQVFYSKMNLLVSSCILKWTLFFARCLKAACGFSPVYLIAS